MRVAAFVTLEGLAEVLGVLRGGFVREVEFEFPFAPRVFLLPWHVGSLRHALARRKVKLVAGRARRAGSAWCFGCSFRHSRAEK